MSVCAKRKPDEMEGGEPVKSRKEVEPTEYDLIYAKLEAAVVASLERAFEEIRKKLSDELEKVRALQLSFAKLGVVTNRENSGDVRARAPDLSAKLSEVDFYVTDIPLHLIAIANQILMNRSNCPYRLTREHLCQVNGRALRPAVETSNRYCILSNVQGVSSLELQRQLPQPTNLAEKFFGKNPPNAKEPSVSEVVDA